MKILFSGPTLMGIITPPEYLVADSTFPRYSGVLLPKMILDSILGPKADIVTYSTRVVYYLKRKKTSVSIFSVYSGLSILNGQVSTCVLPKLIMVHYSGSVSRGFLNSI